MVLQVLTVKANVLVPICHPSIPTASKSDTQPRIVECLLEDLRVATKHAGDDPLFEGYLQKE